MLEGSDPETLSRSVKKLYVCLQSQNTRMPVGRAQMRGRLYNSLLLYGSRTSNSLQGEICDIDGTCVDAGGDELFKLTTKDGKLTVETEKVYSLLTRSCSHAEPMLSE